MSKLLEALQEATNKTKTENHADAFKSTKSDVLDLFSLGGAVRSMDRDGVYRLISRALAEDFDLGIRTVLYLSDIREGQGERDFLKTAIKVLVDGHSRDMVEKFILKIPSLTRWDYLFEFFDTKYEKFVLDFIAKEIKEIDEERLYGNSVTSLLYKWLPSVQRKPAMAKKIAEHLGMNLATYRKMLSKERANLKVVEVDMSARRWDEIDYEHVPSKAALIYRNAFMRNDEAGYQVYLDSVKKGEKKINAGVTYPHEIIQRVMRGDKSETLDVIWNSLPNYVEDKDHIVLPLIDVSGSMGITVGKGDLKAIHCSIGLGIYLAERNEGPFKDYFLTFSSDPQLDRVRGKNIFQKVNNLERADWGGTTDFYKAFETILDAAVASEVHPDEMPKTVVVFSDMEFNEADRGRTPYQSIEQLYTNAGYRLPQLVFWNLNARNKQHPVTMDGKGTILVSGYSPITLKFVLENELVTPYEMMLKIIMSNRYKIID